MSKRWAEIREAVFTRDRYQCTNCLGSVEETAPHDPDHNVPRGAGGSDRLSNITTLCRQCHEAKHGDGIAPTVRLQSTGDMSSVEFCWFKQFHQEIVPAVARHFDIHLVPKFGLDDGQAWHYPLGDLRRWDQQLANAELEYRSLRAEDYM